MPKFDVCAEASAIEQGAAMELAECNASTEQTFVFSDSGAISPAADPNLCLTLGDATRFGRSKQNQIKALSLETCAPESAAMQTWATRTGLD
ncbi:ricin-type beta-trefoil lectin domain protein [Shimia haliotis]|nr:ricin-type beta-trefoil lectin domain protein [Shimia haliotis]